MLGHLRAMHASVSKALGILMRTARRGCSSGWPGLSCRSVHPGGTRGDADRAARTGALQLWHDVRTSTARATMASRFSAVASALVEEPPGYRDLRTWSAPWTRVAPPDDVVAEVA